MNGFEENEISKNAFGGTEIAKRKLAEIIDSSLLEEFQIVSSRIRELNENKIRIFWAHDLPEDPESAKFQDPQFVSKFHKLVFISNWQYQRYQLVRGIPYNTNCIVLESGIEPAPNDVFDQKDKDIIRLVYTSTPQRGLKLLIPVFNKLLELHNNIHLDVFSSFKIYGWEEPDEFSKLYEEIKAHPNMTYHGFVPNTELKNHLNKSHIFAYPCIWLETSCRAMLESMSAGLVCVHPNYGALPETSGGLNIMYQGDMQDATNHMNVFANALHAAINIVKEDKHINMVRFSKIYVDSRFGINNIKNHWENMLKNLIQQYPTVESRKFPTEQFVYRT